MKYLLHFCTVKHAGDYISECEYRFRVEGEGMSRKNRRAVQGNKYFDFFHKEDYLSRGFKNQQENIKKWMFYHAGIIEHINYSSGYNN